MWHHKHDHDHKKANGSATVQPGWLVSSDSFNLVEKFSGFAKTKKKRYVFRVICSQTCAVADWPHQETCCRIFGDDLPPMSHDKTEKVRGDKNRPDYNDHKANCTCSDNEQLHLTSPPMVKVRGGRLLVHGSRYSPLMNLKAP